MADDQHDHDHDHDDDHDHDHEHDHEHEHDEDYEPTPEEIAAAELAIGRLGAALALIDDESLRRALASMRETTRMEMAQQLGLSRATMHLGDALVPLFRRKVRNASPERQLAIAFSLAESVNDDAVEALGDSHEDPELDELRAVLPGVVEKHGPATVKLMLAAYAASDAVSQPVIAELLDTDEEYALPDAPPDDDEPEFSLELHHRTAEEEAEQERKREQRKAAKEAKRVAAQAQREAVAAGQAARREAQHQAKKQPRP